MQSRGLGDVYKRQQYRCEHPVHRLELTPELFLVLDGQTLADFGGDNWRQKLEEMELVL